VLTGTRSAHRPADESACGAACGQQRGSADSVTGGAGFRCGAARVAQHGFRISSPCNLTGNLRCPQATKAPAPMQNSGRMPNGRSGNGLRGPLRQRRDFLLISDLHRIEGGEPNSLRVSPICSGRKEYDRLGKETHVVGRRMIPRQALSASCTWLRTYRCRWDGQAPDCIFPSSQNPSSIRHPFVRGRCSDADSGAVLPHSHHRHRVSQAWRFHREHWIPSRSDRLAHTAHA
jgi:hypothetical protein